MKTLRLLLAAVLLWLHGPETLCAQTLAQARQTPVTAAPALVVPGLAPSLGGPALSLALTLSLPSASLPTVSAPRLGTVQTAPARASIPAAILPAASLRQAASVLQALPLQAAQAAQTAPLAQPAKWEAAVGGVSAVQESFRGEDGKLKLSQVFENAKPASNSAAEPISAAPSVAPSGLRPAVQGDKAVFAEDPPEPELPRPFKRYLLSQSLYALGQQAACILVPMLAFTGHGAGFAVLSETLSLAAIIPGSWFGARWVERFDSKRVTIIAAALEGVLLASIPVLHFALGAVPALYFLAFNAARGFIYGAMRGVAEKEILSRIVGAGDKQKLKNAGAAFFAVFSAMETVAAVVTVALLPSLGAAALAIAMGAAMILSAMGLLAVPLRGGGAAEEAPGGKQKRLSAAEAWPYVFSQWVFLAFYSFFSPLISYGVFESGSLGAWSVGAYTVGSLAVSAFLRFFPNVHVSRRTWTLAAMAATLAYLLGSAFIPVPALSAVLAGVMGVGVGGSQVRWSTHYQNNLDQSVQPREFQRLTTWTVVCLLALSAVMEPLILGFGLPMSAVIGVAAAVIAAAAGTAFWRWPSRPSAASPAP
ncbi:MAG TPA: hypothetical protein DCM05_08130 [Elusimicrobia bacterium]|nr:hypothetical protein [Elusimicrobiota bacterium]